MPQFRPRPPRRGVVYAVEISGRFYSRAYYGAQFKAANRPPVKGGRWQVRKLARGSWRAWTHGSAKRWSMITSQHWVAFAWAQVVVKYYADRTLTPEERDEELKRLRKLYHNLDKGLGTR